MGDGNWLSRGIRRKSSGKPRDKRHGQSAQAPAIRGTLGIEQLEDRRVLATFLVTNFNDVDGGGATILGSLRWAIESANANADRDIIVFAETAWTIPGANQTINLNGGTLAIEQPVDIMGPGARKLTVQQHRVNQRVFDIAIEGDDEIFSLQISGMTISGGNVVGQERSDNSGFDCRVIIVILHIFREIRFPFFFIVIRVIILALSELSKMLHKIIGHMLLFHTGRSRLATLVGRRRFTIWLLR